MKQFLLLLLLTFNLSTQARISEEDLQKVSQKIDIPITILKDPTVNAYAKKDGIFIFTGLMELPSANESTMTVVLLHEQGHINLDHHIQSMSAAVNLDVEQYLCGDIITKDSAKCMKDAYYRYTAKIRKLEYEADNYAYLKAKKLGITNKGCEFFKELAQNEKGVNELEVDHPLSIKRYQKCMSILPS